MNACTRTTHRLTGKVSKNTEKFRLTFNQISLSEPNVELRIASFSLETVDVGEILGPALGSDNEILNFFFVEYGQYVSVIGIQHENPL